MNAFLSGKPVAYAGFDGHLYIATYFKSDNIGVPHLRVVDARSGRRKGDLLMSQHEAMTFFWNLDTVS